MSVAVAVVLNIHDGHATAKKDIIIVMVVAFDLNYGLCWRGRGGRPFSFGVHLSFE